MNNRIIQKTTRIPPVTIEGYNNQKYCKKAISQDSETLTNSQYDTECWAPSEKLYSRCKHLC